MLDDGMVLSEIGLSWCDAVDIEVVFEQLAFLKANHHAAQAAKQREDWVWANEAYFTAGVADSPSNSIA